MGSEFESELHGGRKRSKSVSFTDEHLDTSLSMPNSDEMGSYVGFWRAGSLTKRYKTSHENDEHSHDRNRNSSREHESGGIGYNSYHNLSYVQANQHNLVHWVFEHAPVIN